MRKAKDIVRERESVSTYEMFRTIASEMPTDTFRSQMIQALDANGACNSPKGIGKMFTDYPLVANEWLSVYVNKVVKQTCTNTIWTKFDTSFFRKGVLDYGDSIEDTYWDLIQSMPYSMNRDGSKNFKDYTQKNPHVAFYTINIHRQYVKTVYVKRLAKACTSWGSVEEFLNGLAIAVENSMRVDNFILWKFLMVSAYLRGNAGKKITLDDGYTSEELTEIMRTEFEDMQYFDNTRSVSKADTMTEAENVMYMVSNKTQATLDVGVLASAFNMDKTTFLGKRVKTNIIGFTEWEEKRLNQLINQDGTQANNFEDATPVLSDADREACEKIVAILFDKKLPQVWQYGDMTAENEYDMYGKKTNTVYDIEESWSASPFADFVVVAEQ